MIKTRGLIVDIGNGASCHVGYKSCFYSQCPWENR